MEWDINNEVSYWDINNETEILWDEDRIQAFVKWPTEGKMLGLLDADLIPYIVGYMASSDAWFKACQLVEGLKERSDKWYKKLLNAEECEDVIKFTNLVINSWLHKAGCDAAKFFLTDSPNQYRFKIATLKEYKGNAARKREKPPFFYFIKMYIEREHGAIVATDCEADDLMSIEQYQANQELVYEGAKQGSKHAMRFSKTVIISKDKDLRMIPGWHYNPSIKECGPFWVDYKGELFPEYNDDGKMTSLKGTGLKFFYAQMIMGDTTDNYPGIVGLGPAKAFEVLEPIKKPKEMHEAVLSLYKRKYGEDKTTIKTWDDKEVEVTYLDMFVEQGRMAWMQRKHGEMFMAEHKLPRG